MTGHGRHAAGRPPSLVLPVIATALLIALAAGGWLLFAQPSDGQAMTLAGDQARLPEESPAAPSAAAAGAAEAASTSLAPAAAPSAARKPRRTAEPEPAPVPSEPAPSAEPEVPDVSDEARSFPDLQRRLQLRAKRPADDQLLNGPVAELNWDAMARCESQGNPRAINPRGYYGLYQFSRPGWRSVGGTGLPHHASPAEQTRRAQLLYLKSGRSQWPHCASQLFTR